MAFLDSTVVNVALPSKGRDLHAGLAGLQWTVNGYLLTLGSLLLLGGSLGDLYGRRRLFLTGLAAFTAASALCGLAPSMGVLIAARAVQGVGGAMLVPGSLALLTASFRADDRSAAVGAWSGLAGVAAAVGPFVGGWLVDGVSWRLVFLLNLPVAVVAIVITVRHVPESRGAEAVHSPDVAGALIATLGLGGLVFALIQWSAHGASAAVVDTGVIGGLALHRLLNDLSAAPEGVEAAAIALGRPARRGVTHEPGCRRLTRWHRWAVIDHALGGHGGSDPLVDHARHLELPVAVVGPGGDPVADPYRRPRFGRATVDSDVARPAGPGGLRPGAVEADSPQPPIDPRRGPVAGHGHSRATADTWQTGTPASSEASRSTTASMPHS